MSNFGPLADEYLRLRRRLGHNMDDAARLLPRFVAYLDAIGADSITVGAALGWSQCPDADPTSTVWSRRMTVARGFARYMAGSDPHTQVPPLGLLSHRRHWRPPFIYSPADIAALLAEVRKKIRPPFRSSTYQTLIGLLAVTGMRVGEAIRLDRPDVNLNEGLIVVRASKFGKSREVPLHASTTEALAVYSRQRDEFRPRPQESSFFISTRGTRLIYQVVQEVFRSIVEGAGVGAGAPVRPRIHDLRHSFAVRTLTEWYRNGEDVEGNLPRLATYLGHRDPRSSYWYLSAAPEVLALAASRLEAAEGGYRE